MNAKKATTTPSTVVYLSSSTSSYRKTTISPNANANKNTASFEIQETRNNDTANETFQKKSKMRNVYAMGSLTLCEYEFFVLFVLCNRKLWWVCQNCWMDRLLIPVNAFKCTPESISFWNEIDTNARTKHRKPNELECQRLRLQLNFSARGIYGKNMYWKTCGSVWLLLLNSEHTQQAYFKCYK